MILRSLFYIIAAILAVGWLLGVFYFHIPGILIHILAILAVTAVIIGIFRKNDVE